MKKCVKQRRHKVGRCPSDCRALPCKEIDNVLPGVLRTHRSLGFATEQKTKHLERWRLNSVRANKNPINSH